MTRTDRFLEERINSASAIARQLAPCCCSRFISSWLKIRRGRLNFFPLSSYCSNN
jgi:hypothetical protein